MLRLFTAIPLSPPIRAELAGLCGGVPGARWTAPENLHLTLRFIGEVPEDIAADIDEALSTIRAPGFPLILTGIGQFGAAAKPRILWAGVARNEALMHLQKKIESMLIRAGCEGAAHKFSPHVTLARLDNPDISRLGRFIAEHNLLRSSTMMVDRFTLFASHLGAEQPFYEALQDYPLG